MPALTFMSPPDLFCCRLPDGWTGSDHGTIPWQGTQDRMHIEGSGPRCPAQDDFY